MNYVAGLIVLLSLTAAVAADAAQPGNLLLVQATPHNSAHTLVSPPSAQGRVGQAVPLPQGGTGITTGSTPNYQTLTTPGGGSGIAVPNGAASSTITGTGGRSGTILTPK
jgi:hypothetical protein